MLHTPLLNFSTYLQSTELKVFSDWILLNQAAVEELGLSQGGLRGITKSPQSSIYQSIISHYKPAFLIMSANDEKSLNLHKQSFKNYKQKYLIGSFCLKTFGHDFTLWRESMGAFQYYIENLLTTKQDSFDQLMKDLMCVFVLDASLLTMKYVQAGQGQEAANTFASMAIGCH